MSIYFTSFSNEELYQLVEDIQNFNLRNNEESIGFGFKEDLFRISYLSTDRGRSLDIYLVAEDGDELNVYEASDFYRGFKERNRGLTDGPWKNKLEEIILKLKNEVVDYKIINHVKNYYYKTVSEETKINKFKKLFKKKIEKIEVKNNSLCFTCLRKECSSRDESILMSSRVTICMNYEEHLEKAKKTVYDDHNLLKIHKTIYH